jgi:hypothetical protein
MNSTVLVESLGSLALSEDSDEIPDLKVSESGAEMNCDALAVMLYKANAGTMTKPLQSPNTTRKNSESRSDSILLSSTQNEALHARNARGGEHLDRQSQKSPRTRLATHYPSGGAENKSRTIASRRRKCEDASERAIAENQAGEMSPALYSQASQFKCNASGLPQTD